MSKVEAGKKYMYRGYKQSYQVTVIKTLGPLALCEYYVQFYRYAEKTRRIVRTKWLPSWRFYL